MNKPIFIGRQEEFKQLKTLYHKKKPALVVIKGRRRIGKSRLVEEFASRQKNQKFWSFAGMPPHENLGEQGQRDHFARQLALILKVPSLTFLDWIDAFEYLGRRVKPGDIVLFDEISWMGEGDSSFIPKLKAWWDEQKKSILFVICGSISTWIEENILNSTAFFGRIQLTLTLDPLSIPESAELLRKIGMQLSTYEVYQILVIVGGVPWYLEQFSPELSLMENLQQLAFKKEGLLVLEFNRIFHDLFQARGSTYKKIMQTLKEGAKTLSAIRSSIGYAHSGTLSQMLEHLIVAGFVAKQPLWSFKTTKPLKQSLYRINDPYMRFYLKFIEPQLPKINIARKSPLRLQNILNFEVHLGLQLECLMLQNRHLLLNAMGVPIEAIVLDGPYRQAKTTKQPGCQIDYLIQTETRSLLICEFKFSKREIKSEIITDMEEKIKALKIPRGFSSLPVLVHLSGVSDGVATASYFYRIVDLGDLLDMKNETL